MLYDKGVPALKNVVGLPFCDIGFAVQGEHPIIVATEDNSTERRGGTKRYSAPVLVSAMRNAVSYFKGAMMNPLIIKLGGVLLG
ncbi:hypothetical protein ACNKHV_25180 [Shigella flexneri]